MKTVNIIAIAITVIFVAVIFFYIDKVWSARMADWTLDYDDYLYWDSQRRAPAVTREAGFVTLLFFLFYVFVNISNMVRVKTVTTKVLSIIGISFNGIILIWCGLMISTPTHLSFDEVSGAWFVFAMIMLAFSIVYLVQSLKKPKSPLSDPEVIDDIL